MRGYFGTTVMAVFSIALIAYEWDFGRRRVAGEAVVSWSHYAGGRSGLWLNEVVLRVDGFPIKATLRTFYYHLEAGRTVPVLYLPDEPDSVELDLFWHRHYGSALALTAFACFAFGETLNAQTRRRKQASLLYSDDPAGNTDASEIFRRPG